MRRFLITSVSAFALLAPGIAAADMQSEKTPEAPETTSSGNYTPRDLEKDLEQGADATGDALEATGEAVEEGASDTAGAVDDALTNETELRTLADLQAEGRVSSANVIGADVTGADGGEVATIHDVVVSSDGEARAILSDGGIMGMAPRLTAVSFTGLKPSYEEGELKNFSGDWSADDLKDRQTFVYEKAEGETASEAEVIASSSTSLLDLTGQDVSNNAGETVAEIEQFYLDENGKPRHAVLEAGGFLGVDSKRVAIDYDDMTIAQGAGGPTVALTRAQLEADAGLELDTE